MAQLNLSDSLLAQGLWVESAETARLAVATLRRAGSAAWSFATGNLLQALLFAGRWDEVEEIARNTEADGGADDPYFAWCTAMLYAFRGSTEALPGLIEAVHRMAGSEDPQDRSTVAVTDSIIAFCAGDIRRAAERARDAIAEGEQIGGASEGIRWCWPVAADSALELDDLDEVDRLLEWAATRPEGHLHPVVRVDRLRVQARLLAARGDPDADVLFINAVQQLRALGSPYHLAIGLSDHAQHLAGAGNAEAAEPLHAEAQLIAQQLGARPLLARIVGADVESARR
jgi:hypothetical protein